VRHKGNRNQPASNVRDVPELCHCRRKDRVLGSGPMASLRRSPCHAEGGMFMLPPTQDRAHPYGRAPPDAPQGARPNRLDRLRQALPSRNYSRRTEQTHCDWLKPWPATHLIQTG